MKQWRDSSGGAMATSSVPVFERLIAERRPLVMGVLNVTPDSFSDGGRHLDPARALAHARDMIQAGADLIDVGAESTRPYGDARPVPLEEELDRLTPTLPAVVALGAPVSVDTMKAAVAARALEMGAAMINDVWGLQRDPDMARVVAKFGAPVVVMHNRDQADPSIDIMAEVIAFLARSVEIAERAGIARRHLVLDPGIGFGKTPEQSIVVLSRLHELRRFDLPLLIGASRKRFIAAISPSESGERLGGSIAAHVLAVLSGAKFVRTHDVAETVQALRVTEAIRRPA